LKRFANGKRRGAPPIARILLRPAGLRTGEIGVLFGARSEYCAVLVKDNRARAACSDINAEDWNGAS